MSIKEIAGSPSLAKHSQIRYRVYNILMIILVICALAGCALTDKTAGLKLHPITEPPTHVYHQGKFVWNDLLTDDVAVAKDFYGQLFGWTFESSGSYTIVKNNGQSIAGIAQINKTSKIKGAARWICVLSVENVDDAASLVTEEGGLVHIGPLDTSGRGREALVRDPQGAQLILLHALGGDPEDKEPIIGSWLWHELWSNDPKASLAFYQTLAGYEYDGEMDNYLILYKDEKLRAGIRSLQDTKLEGRWLPVVRVLDTNEIAAQAKKLGGRLLVGPRPTKGNGSVALLSDPSGALIIVQRWDEKNLEQEK